MRKNKTNKAFKLFLITIILLFISNVNYAQQTQKLMLPDLDLVPNGLDKPSFQLYSEKSEKLKIEIGKLMDEENLLNQKIKGLSPDSRKAKKYQAQLDLLIPKVTELTPQINDFNTEIEKTVYNDPSMEKLSIITYFTLKTDQQSWDEFQKTMANAKIKLKEDKVKIQQELTKINTRKQKIKTAYEEGVVLSMYTEQDVKKALDDSLNPLTGASYKETNADTQTKNLADSGSVIVSFVMPKQENDPMEIASKRADRIPSEPFSLASPRTKDALNRIKDKNFHRLIAHSNGATLVECLLNDSLIGAKELNIIGGEKSLLDGQSLQYLLDNGIVKRIIVWVKLDDPAIWLTSLDEDTIAELAANFISYKTKVDAKNTPLETSKVEYKWILSRGSLAELNAQDPQFMSIYFREILKDLRAK